MLYRVRLVWIIPQQAKVATPVQKAPTLFEYLWLDRCNAVDGAVTQANLLLHC